MFIIRIWNYFRGYAIIIVEGLKIERFLNLAVLNGIYIWDIHKVNYTTIKAKINIRNFSKLREIVKKTGSSIRIEDKRGFPFFLKRAKKRKFLYTGILLLIISVFMLSSYVWMIEIVGAKTVDKEVILKKLNAYGLREGIRKGKIDKHGIENKMLIDMSEIAWLGIQVKGTKAIVEVVEKREVPPLLTRDDACDIVATKDGIISKLLVLNGDGIVKDGQTVKKGQVLVSGTIVRQDMENRFTHAMAQVNARTWYEDVEEIPLNQIEYKKTGKAETHYALKILNKVFARKTAIPYKEYNVYVEEKNLLSFGDYVFPLKLISTKYEALSSTAKSVTVQQAKDRCAERLTQRIRLQIPEDAVVLNKKISYYVEKKQVKAKISVEVLEDIGLEKKITPPAQVPESQPGQQPPKGQQTPNPSKPNQAAPKPQNTH